MALKGLRTKLTPLTKHEPPQSFGHFRETMLLNLLEDTRFKEYVHLTWKLESQETNCGFSPTPQRPQSKESWSWNNVRHSGQLYSCCQPYFHHVHQSTPNLGTLASILWLPGPDPGFSKGGGMDTFESSTGFLAIENKKTPTIRAMRISRNESELKLADRERRRRESFLRGW
jgi:hypothetical protein